MSRRLGSQRFHLDAVDLRCTSSLGGEVQPLQVVAGDDEDDGGGVEGDPLLGPLPAVTRVGHDDGPDGALGRSQGPLFEVALEPRDPRAEQPQETAPELEQNQETSGVDEKAHRSQANIV